MSVRRGVNTILFQKAIVKTHGQMVSHDLYKAGFGIASFGHAINPELVLGISDVEVADLADKIFTFDTTIVPKSKETMIPFKVCSQLHGGLCCKDGLCHRADTGSRNVHNLLRRHELKAPIPFTFEM